MKFLSKKTYKILTSLTLVFLLTTNVFAAIPTQLNYQGKLTNSSGVTVTDGSYNMRFKLYTTPTGGVPVWTEAWRFFFHHARDGTRKPY
jgi:hypothetical protein